MAQPGRNASIEWLPWMDAMIRDNWDSVSTRDLSTRLKVSQWSIRRRAAQLKLPPRPRGGLPVVYSKLADTVCQHPRISDEADRVATMEFEAIYCDWAERRGFAIHGYRAAA